MEDPWPMIVGLLLFIVPTSLLFFMTDMPEEDLLPTAVMILASAIAVGFGLRLQTFLKLDAEGLWYKASPFFKKLRFISKEDMEHWAIIDYGWRNYRGMGYKRRLWGPKIFVMKTGKVLQIKTRNGEMFLFGINSEAQVKHFIQNEWENKQQMYGW